MTTSLPRFTLHSLLRVAERQLRDDVLEFILDFGVEHRAAGASHVTVLERRLPPELRATPIARRARGWILVLNDDGALITCYRRFDAASFLRKKPKCRLSPQQRDDRGGR